MIRETFLSEDPTLGKTVFVACCVLAAQTLSSRGAFRAQYSGSEEMAYETARVALLVIRTIADSTGAPTDTYRMFPSRSPQPVEEIARILSLRRKPVRCSLRRESDTVTIGCQTIVDPRSRAWLQRVSVEHVSWWGEIIGKECAGRVETTHLAIRGAVDTVTVTFLALAALFRDYDMPFSIGQVMVSKPPQGACMVLAVGRGANLRRGSPPDPRS
jgi:hypothetical protein